MRRGARAIRTTVRIVPPTVLFHDGADNASLSDASRKALSRFVRSSPIGREVTMSTRPDFTFARAKSTPASNASFRSTSAARNGSRYMPGTSTRMRWPSSFAFSKCHENFQDPCRAAPCTSCDADSEIELRNSRLQNRQLPVELPRTFPEENFSAREDYVYALKIIFDSGFDFIKRRPSAQISP